MVQKQRFSMEENERGCTNLIIFLNNLLNILRAEPSRVTLNGVEGQW